MDKALYQIIADEMAAKKMDAALWAKAMAIADGDADKTQAAYIRLRFADLKKTATRQPSIPSLDVVPNAGVSQIDPLQRTRTELKQKLLAHGKSSLYATLGLQPDASDALIANAIADLGNNIQASSSAEFNYARTILGNPASRQQYDQKLLNDIVCNATTPIRISTSEYAANDEPWWSARRTSVVIAIIACSILGYWSIDLLRAQNGHEVQQEVVDVQRDALGVQRDVTQSAIEIERLRLQNENELRQRAMSMAEASQQRSMEYQAQAQERAQAERERRETLEQERLRQQQERTDSQNAQRGARYWNCINQQLDSGTSNADAYARCASYR